MQSWFEGVCAGIEGMEGIDDYLTRIRGWGTTIGEWRKLNLLIIKGAYLHCLALPCLA